MAQQLLTLWRVRRITRPDLPPRLAAKATGIYYVALSDWELMARLLHQTEEEDLGDLDALLARHHRPTSGTRARSRTPPRLEPSTPDVLLASIPHDWKEAEVAGWLIPGLETAYFFHVTTSGTGAPELWPLMTDVTLTW